MSSPVQKYKICHTTMIYQHSQFTQTPNEQKKVNLINRSILLLNIYNISFIPNQTFGSLLFVNPFRSTRIAKLISTSAITNLMNKNITKTLQKIASYQKTR